MRIKELIRNKGLTIEEFAESIGMKQSSISRAINGNPTLDTLQKIADGLQVDISELFTPAQDFTALISYNGNLYHFRTVEELKQFADTL